MYLVELKKVSNNISTMRTKQITGIAYGLPVVGQPFAVIAEPLSEEASFRYVITSLVKEIKTSEEIFVAFDTLNSSYELKIFGEKK